ncbi:hypothetical protein C8F01DRAFT_1083268 [Mycena amicta]|nr:hypothetical protein C8F01DRAFT_1083268 [Mycena amicta]
MHQPLRNKKAHTLLAPMACQCTHRQNQHFLDWIISHSRYDSDACPAYAETVRPLRGGLGGYPGDEIDTTLAHIDLNLQNLNRVAYSGLTRSAWNAGTYGNWQIAQIHPDESGAAEAHAAHGRAGAAGRAHRRARGAHGHARGAHGRARTQGTRTRTRRQWPTPGNFPEHEGGPYDINTSSRRTDFSCTSLAFDSAKSHMPSSSPLSSRRRSQKNNTQGPRLGWLPYHVRYILLAFFFFVAALPQVGARIRRRLGAFVCSEVVVILARTRLGRAEVRRKTLSARTAQLEQRVYLRSTRSCRRREGRVGDRMVVVIKSEVERARLGASGRYSGVRTRVSDDGCHSSVEGARSLQAGTSSSGSPSVGASGRERSYWPILSIDDRWEFTSTATHLPYTVHFKPLRIQLDENLYQAEGLCEWWEGKGTAARNQSRQRQRDRADSHANIDNETVFNLRRSDSPAGTIPTSTWHAFKDVQRSTWVASPRHLAFVRVTDGRLHWGYRAGEHRADWYEPRWRARATKEGERVRRTYHGEQEEVDAIMWLQPTSDRIHRTSLANSIASTANGQRDDFERRISSNSFVPKASASLNVPPTPPLARTLTDAANALNAAPCHESAPDEILNNSPNSALDRNANPKRAYDNSPTAACAEAAHFRPLTLAFAVSVLTRPRIPQMQDLQVHAICPTLHQQQDYRRRAQDRMPSGRCMTVYFSPADTHSGVERPSVIPWTRGVPIPRNPDPR